MISASAPDSANGHSKEAKGGVSAYTAVQSSVSSYEVVQKREPHDKAGCSRGPCLYGLELGKSVESTMYC